MPEKVSAYCPFCNKHTEINPASGTYTERTASGSAERSVPVAVKSQGTEWWIALCHFCQNPMLVGHKGVVIHPSPRPSPTDERIDKPARLALVEAKVCFAAGAINASATMARRAIQAGVIRKGATKDKLRDQIDELRDKGLITADLAAWAHEVRYAGNDGAHPEDEVTKGQAEDILELAEQFLTVLFVTPALAEERRKKRQGGAGP